MAHTGGLVSISMRPGQVQSLGHSKPQSWSEESCGHHGPRVNAGEGPFRTSGMKRVHQ